MCGTNNKTGKNVLTFPCFLVVLTGFLLVFGPEMGWARGMDFNKGGKYCSQTSYAALYACRNEVRDDYWIAVGNCNNVSDDEARQECLEDAVGDWQEAIPECRAQLEARLDVCAELGEGRYDPELNPDDFINPEDGLTPNSYFPLTAGNYWVYQGVTEEDGETITEEIRVEVKHDTKEIEYPADSGNIFNCVVVQDVATVGGEIIEDTLDWYAQDEEGNIWYFGEISKNYEEGELVDVEGSWLAGREDAKPGIVMYAAPQEDDFYRQEWALGDAEDMGAVESLDEKLVFTREDETKEEFTDVLKTRDFTPIEPDVLEFKYYAPGVGLVLEVDDETGEQVVLIETNVVPYP